MMSRPLCTVNRETRLRAVEDYVDAAHPSLSDPRRRMIVAQAEGHLRTWYFGTAEEAVEIALKSDLKHWGSFVSESWYREHVARFPEDARPVWRPLPEPWSPPAARDCEEPDYEPPPDPVARGRDRQALRRDEEAARDDAIRKKILASIED